MYAADRRGGLGALNSSTTLTLQLSDINDHAPVFPQKVFDFGVSEGLEGNVFVGEVEAEDEDIDPNNRLSYAIVSGADGRFYMDRTNGKMKIMIKIHFILHWLFKITKMKSTKL